MWTCVWTYVWTLYMHVSRPVNAPVHRPVYRHVYGMCTVMCADIRTDTCVDMRIGMDVVCRACLHLLSALPPLHHLYIGSISALCQLDIGSASALHRLTSTILGRLLCMFILGTSMMLPDGPLPNLKVHLLFLTLEGNRRTFV